MSDTEHPGEAEARLAAEAAFGRPVMLEGYLLITTAVDADGARVWAIRGDVNASAFTNLGLAHLAHRYLEDLTEGMLAEDEEG